METVRTFIGDHNDDADTAALTSTTVRSEVRN